MSLFDFSKAISLHNNSLTRRQFFHRNAVGLGVAALTSLLPKEVMAAIEGQVGTSNFAPKAKRVIYISLVGAPSQLETFDYKPNLTKDFKKDIKGFLEKSGQVLTGMTAGQSKFPVAPARVGFKQYGESGTWVSDYLPYIGKMADDICVVKTMHTDAINHEPANQLLYTGSMQSGKASIGSWLSYGLGSMNDELPSFCVLHAQHSSPFSNVQAISSRLWGSGYLPGKYSGVNLRSKGDAVLFLNDAPGVERKMRREMLDGLNALNQKSFDNIGDPEIQTRMEQYEMAFKMQTSVPELTDMSNETKATYELYGPDSKKEGSFAHCALMARRLAERGVQFTQIFHRGWDTHSNLPRDMESQCKDVDQAAYALVQDLKQRGMLEDTLVIFGGEFGRTVYSQGTLTEDNYGRDHHPRAFSIWMAGAGIKAGHTFGETDEYSFNITTPDEKMHVRDLHATMLHLCGLDHHKLTFKYQGLDQKLTGVKPAQIIKGVLA